MSVWDGLGNPETGAAAAMLTGDLVFTVEVHVEGLVQALQDVGVEARNLLADEQGGGLLPADIVAWRSPRYDEERQRREEAELRDPEAAGLVILPVGRQLTAS